MFTSFLFIKFRCSAHKFHPPKTRFCHGKATQQEVFTAKDKKLITSVGEAAADPCNPVSLTLLSQLICSHTRTCLDRRRTSHTRGHQQVHGAVPPFQDMQWHDVFVTGTGSAQGMLLDIVNCKENLMARWEARISAVNYCHYLFE